MTLLILTLPQARRLLHSINYALTPSHTEPYYNLYIRYEDTDAYNTEGALGELHDLLDNILTSPVLEIQNLSEDWHGELAYIDGFAKNDLAWEEQAKVFVENYSTLVNEHGIIILLGIDRHALTTGIDDLITKYL